MAVPQLGPIECQNIGEGEHEHVFKSELGSFYDYTRFQGAPLGWRGFTRYNLSDPRHGKVPKFENFQSCLVSKGEDSSLWTYIQSVYPL